ncbi:hypothetical protein BKI52_38340 [marine bacterium AO1-C]|nr:hypothetical protein BKI52_38340 [marine bacterium AO1-C]
MKKSLKVNGLTAQEMQQLRGGGLWTPSGDKPEDDQTNKGVWTPSGDKPDEDQVNKGIWTPGVNQKTGVWTPGV